MKTGTWRFVNTDKTKFAVGWTGTVERWYDIVSIDSEKIIISPDSSGPCGSGLGSVTNLLKSAKSKTQNNNTENSELAGKWYYNESKTGKYLDLQLNGKCQYYHYQDIAGTTADGWVISNGEWNYSSNEKKLSIGMNGEISYTYEVVELTTNTLQIKPLSDSPTGSSIFSESKYYR